MNQIALVSALSIAGLAASVSAQQALRELLPVDYSAEGLLDVRAARECELWDGVARSPFLAPALGAFRDKLGFDLSQIDRILLAMSDPVEQDDPMPPSRDLVVTFEGDGAIGIPKFVLDSERYQPVEIGKVRAYQWTHPAVEAPGQIFCVPGPGSLVYGAPGVLEPALRACDFIGLITDDASSHALSGRGAAAATFSEAVSWIS